MKTKSLITVAVLCLLYGCGGKGSMYEKAIADYVQTSKRGVWTDMQFKVLEMGEAEPITVGDSIRILTEAFEADKAKWLSNLQRSLDRHKASLEKESSSSMRKFYRTQIEREQHKIDSVGKTSVSLPDAYRQRPETDVLAQEVVCKYSIVPPIINTRQEETRVFVLNAAGDKCYRSRAVTK